MELQQLKLLIKDKSKEFEQAIQQGRQHSELLQIYKEIKQIAFEIIQKENEVVFIPE